MYHVYLASFKQIIGTYCLHIYHLCTPILQCRYMCVMYIYEGMLCTCLQTPKQKTKTAEEVSSGLIIAINMEVSQSSWGYPQSSQSLDYSSIETHGCYLGISHLRIPISIKYTIPALPNMTTLPFIGWKVGRQICSPKLGDVGVEVYPSWENGKWFNFQIGFQWCCCLSHIDILYIGWLIDVFLGFSSSWILIVPSNTKRPGDNRGTNHQPTRV